LLSGFIQVYVGGAVQNFVVDVHFCVYLAAISHFV